jgi:hypothetical protein
MGSTRNCRNRAIRCIEMAHRTSDPRLRATLFELARSWMKLATDSESDAAVCQHGEGVAITPTKH